jgi:spore maturation protein CgeB
MFEIMASGSVLLTDEGDDYGLRELFVDDSYCTYKRDGSDIIKKAKLIINESGYRDLITKQAIKCITEKHTHKIRAKELIDIIEKNFKMG